MKRRIHHLDPPEVHLLGPGQLRIVNGKLTFSRRDAEPARLDPTKLRAVHCYGAVGATDEAIDVLLRHRVRATWLSAGGAHCRGMLVPAKDDRALLRRLQHSVLADPESKLLLARWFVRRKIASQMAAARHFQRQGRLDRSLASSCRQALDLAEQAARSATSLDVLRGHEGVASASWFGLLRHLVPTPFEFQVRSMRPPRDVINALLSIGYTWLLNKILTVVAANGLEPTLGALHDLHPGRPSLACDIIEPLRVPAVDRWVLRVAGLREIDPVTGFQRVQRGGGAPAVLLTRKAFPKMLTSWERSWNRWAFDRELRSTMAVLLRFFRDPDRPLPEPSASFGSDPLQADSQAVGSEEVTP